MEEMNEETLRELLAQALENLPINDMYDSMTDDDDDQDQLFYQDLDFEPSFHESDFAPVYSSEDGGLSADDDLLDGDGGKHDQEWYEFPAEALEKLTLNADREERASFVEHDDRDSLEDGFLGGTESKSEGEDRTLEDGGDELVVSAPAEDSTAQEPKKKRKKKKKKKKATLPLVEDFELDDEALDSLGVACVPTYDPLAVSIEDRFRVAMEDFRKSRRFNSSTAKILSIYFSYGGMDDHKDVVPSQEVESQIDFEYVARTFLSSYLFTRLGWYEMQLFDLAPKVVAGFLTFLSSCDILPECKEEIQRALKAAQVGINEVPMCARFNSCMPDPVSDAFSDTFSSKSFGAITEDTKALVQTVLGADVGIDQVTVLETKMLIVKIVSRQDHEAGFTKVTTTPSVLEATLVLGGINDAVDHGGGGNGDGNGDDQEPVILVMDSAEAKNLLPGFVLEGTITILSNGMSFGRPLLAMPSFYLAEDEDAV